MPGTSGGAQTWRRDVPPILGLLAAALGVERDDHDAWEALRGYRTATRLLTDSAPLRDYHTVQTVPQKIRRPDGRPAALEAVGRDVHTLVTVRDYRTDVAVAVAVWAETARWPLPQLAEALRTPAFVLYLGRKSCPPAAPLGPEVVQAPGPCRCAAFSCAASVPATCAARPRRVGSVSGRSPRPGRNGPGPAAGSYPVALWGGRGLVLRGQGGSMSLYLTRAELDRQAGVAALTPLLDPPAPDRARRCPSSPDLVALPGSRCDTGFPVACRWPGAFFYPVTTASDTMHLVPSAGDNRVRAGAGTWRSAGVPASRKCNP